MEVIELTKDLLSTQPSETLTNSDSFASAQPTHSWKVGDKCMAVWSEDGHHGIFAGVMRRRSRRSMKRTAPLRSPLLSTAMPK